MIGEDRKSIDGGGGDAGGFAANGGGGFLNGTEVKDFRIGDGNSSGFCRLTYKRRKCVLESKDGMASGDSANEVTDKSVRERLDAVLIRSSSVQGSVAGTKSLSLVNDPGECLIQHGRNAVLKQICESLGSEGGLLECIRDALLFHPGDVCSKEFGCFHEDGDKCTSKSNFVNGVRNAAKENIGLDSKRLVDESSNHTVTELCQHTFFDVITSEKFAQLCNLLTENFQGVKVEKILDVSVINSRMKEGTYEDSPMLFCSDIQQVWSKLQKLATEIVALSKCLSEKSRASFRQQFVMRESDMDAKLEQTEGCCVYKVCTCRRCGEKADGRDCLVCDSCEEMYHVSCLEPAVKEIPLRSWYCANCTAKGIESPHENCVVCEKLNAQSPANLAGDEVIHDETITDLEGGLNSLVKDGLQLFKGGKQLPLCKICETVVEGREKFRICGHSFCPHKFYHERCLTRKQLNTYGPCWYCPSCLCRACLSDCDDDKIVLCDGCDHAYHIYCMRPPRASIPRGKWFCQKCDEGIQCIRKAKRTYENLQNKFKGTAQEYAAKDPYLINGEKEKGEEALDKSGGVDMLLNAAKTLEL